ncbi:MAG: hypothetical protein LBQ52_04365, partial [Helicobacteraceae bacterium]|nr:hypothetical protein [Helicobacteraceae bacterium]
VYCGGRRESKPKTYEQRSPLVVCKPEYSRRKSRRIWIPAYAGMTAFVGFALFKVVFQMPRSFRLFSKTAAHCHSRLPSRLAAGDSLPLRRGNDCLWALPY